MSENTNDIVETSHSSEDTARMKASEGETVGSFLWTILTTPNTAIPNSALKTAIEEELNLISSPGHMQMREISLSHRIKHPNLHPRSHGVGNHLRHNQVKHLLLTRKVTEATV
jgi:hypothetical protein